jgi:hypothetical protein
MELAGWREETSFADILRLLSLQQHSIPHYTRHKGERVRCRPTVLAMATHPPLGLPGAIHVPFSPTDIKRPSPQCVGAGRPGRHSLFGNAPSHLSLSGRHGHHGQCVRLIAVHQEPAGPHNQGASPSRA